MKFSRSRTVISAVIDPADVCAPTLTPTASAAGRVSVMLTLADPVWLSQEIGDSIPVYCRADQCHVFLQ
jgi:hypothetical protein